MLDQLNMLAASVGGRNALVDLWLDARRQLLAAYYHLVGIKPNKDSLSVLDDAALDSFCQKLVDYLSSGHFNLYQRLINELKSEKPLAAIVHICLTLQANTDQIMEYYDTHFETAIDDENCLAFQQALSEVGEALEARFTLEDRLILLAYNQPLPSASRPSENTLVRPA